MQLASGTTIRHEPRTPAVTPVQVTKGDKGDPGAPGGSDAAFAAFVTDPASLTRAGLSATYVRGVLPAKYGAVGDGVADDTAEIQAAFDAATSLGGIVHLTGTYRCTAPLLVDSGLAVRLEAKSRLVKDYVAGDDDTTLFIRNRDQATKVTDVSFTGPGEVGASSYSMTGGIFGLYGDRMRLSDFTIRTWSGGRALLVGGDRVRVSHLNIYDCPAVIGNGGIRMFGGKDFIATGCHVEAGDDCFQFVPIANSVSPYYNQSISRGYYIGCTGYSTAARLMVVVHADPGNIGSLTCSINDVGFIGVTGRATQRGIFVVNSESTGVIDGVTFTDCTVDLTGATPMDEAILIRKEVTAGLGAVQNIRLSNVRLVSPVGNIRTVIAQRADGVVFDRCEFPGSGVGQHLLEIAASNRVTVRDTTIRGGGTSNVISVNTSSTDVTVEGCTLLDIPAGVFGVNSHPSIRTLVSRCRFAPVSGSTTSKGIRFDAASTGARAINNDATLLTDAGRMVNLGTDAVFRNNAGWNPRGSVTPPAVPATGVAQTNQSGFDVTVAVVGGTVTNVSIGGVATGLTSGMFRVPAGQTITLAYSVAPTWKWYAD